MFRTTAILACTTACLGFAANAQSSGSMPECDKLVALYIELAKRSGETVSEADARAEVMSGNPTNADCAAMLALFPAQD